MVDRPTSRVPKAPLSELLDDAAVSLGAMVPDQESAIRLVGRLLVSAGAVEDDHVDAMLEREASVSTFVGEGMAFPHATLAGRESVLHDALAVATFPDGVEWNGHTVTVAIGIAAHGQGHIGLLSRLARLLLDPAVAQELASASSTDEVRRLLGGSPGSDESRGVIRVGE